MIKIKLHKPLFEGEALPAAQPAAQPAQPAAPAQQPAALPTAQPAQPAVSNTALTDTAQTTDLNATLAAQTNTTTAIDFKAVINNINLYYVNLIIALKAACSSDALVKAIPELKALGENELTKTAVDELRKAPDAFAKVADAAKADLPETIPTAMAGYNTYLEAISAFLKAILDIASKQVETTQQ